MSEYDVDGLGPGPDSEEPGSEQKPAGRPWRYRLALPTLIAHRALCALRPNAEGFRTLLFHDVPEDKTEAFGRFAETVVRTHGTITPAGAAAWLDGTPPDWTAGKTGSARLPCLFTFDDGFASNHRIAKEVLEPLGIKALFFISPGLVELPVEDQRERIAWTIFDGRIATDEVPEDLTVMTWENLADLLSMGHTIGSHGMLHRRLTRLAGDELDWEIIEAKTVLEARLGAAPDWYAYAFGDVGSISRTALGIIGENYRFCRSGVRGANHPAVARLALRADQIDLDGPFAYQKLATEGGLDFLYREERHHLDEIAAPQPLPDDDESDDDKS